MVGTKVMHIILGLISALGMLLFILWRINLAVQAARELGDAADSARGFFRRRKWNKKVNADQLKQITDPREAATIMMVAIAESDGALTDAEHKKIIEIIIDQFEATQPQAEELLGVGRWMAKDAGDLTSFLNRLVPVIMSNCTDQQKHELIDMLQMVSRVEGEIPPDQAQSIAQIKKYLAI